MKTESADITVSFAGTHRDRNIFSGTTQAAEATSLPAAEPGFGNRLRKQDRSWKQRQCIFIPVAKGGKRI